MRICECIKHPLVEKTNSIQQIRGSVCSEQMVECQAGQVRDAVLIQHSPIGCAASQVGNSVIYRIGMAMIGKPIENLHWISTNLKEQASGTGAGD